jgi:hypothetical protein
MVQATSSSEAASQALHFCAVPLSLLKEGYSALYCPNSTCMLHSDTGRPGEGHISPTKMRTDAAKAYCAVSIEPVHVSLVNSTRSYFTFVKCAFGLECLMSKICLILRSGVMATMHCCQHVCDSACPVHVASGAVKCLPLQMPQHEAYRQAPGPWQSASLRALFLCTLRALLLCTLRTLFAQVIFVRSPEKASGHRLHSWHPCHCKHVAPALAPAHQSHKQAGVLVPRCSDACVHHKCHDALAADAEPLTPRHPLQC